MNGTSINPEHAWQMALDQLHLDMPKAAFETWVSNTYFVSFEDGVFTVGTPGTYCREWLASRLTSTVTRMLTGILNQHVEVQFVVTDEIIETEADDPIIDEESVPDKVPTVLLLQAKYQSIYDEIVKPEQVIVVPGYFMRYIPLLGLELAWLYIGFRQAAYEAGAGRQPGKKFGANEIDYVRNIDWETGKRVRDDLVQRGLLRESHKDEDQDGGGLTDTSEISAQFSTAIPEDLIDDEQA